MSDKVNCHIKIPESLDKQVKNYTIENQLTRAEAVRQLVFLALENVAAPVNDFPGQGTVNCSLNLTKAQFSQANSYRQTHGTVQKTAFFNDAIRRGASVYMNGKSN